VGAACWCLALPLAAVALLRLVAHDALHPLLLLNEFTAYLYLPAYAVLLVALGLRRRRLAVLAALLVTCHLVWLAPGALRASPLAPEAHTAPRLRIFSANLLMSNPDTAGIIGEIIDDDPDVVLVQELSEHWRAALESGVVAERLPHHITEVRESPFGVGIYSRFPLEDAQIVYGWGDPFARATLRVQGRPVRLYDVHPLPPLHSQWVINWEEMLKAVRAAVMGEPAAQGPRGALVLAGDFNMNRQAMWFGRFTELGLRDAHDDRGRGLATTWPNGTQLVPPLRLDHVLLGSKVACLSVHEGRGRGSDHRPLLLDLAVLP
jgi:endonuclease/exonuclease/phosphatase (EEP) superfamily protein YafD